MQRFFAALQAAANNPSSTEAREEQCSPRPRGWAKTFNTLYDQLDKQNSLINQQLGALASQVNHLSAERGQLQRCHRQGQVGGRGAQRPDGCARRSRAQAVRDDRGDRGHTGRQQRQPVHQ
ncbi:FlgK family flagellar hook-associated protein [Pseudomonas aeruginosa]